jgi:membrane fusion protein, heavy metal efflux system
MSERVKRQWSRNARSSRRITLGGLALLAGALVACGNRSGGTEQPSVAYGTSANENVQPQLFTVPAEQMSHVEVVTAAVAPLRRVLRLTGSVQFNNFETTPVITQVSGPVSRVLVSPGDHVQKGQPMLEVASPDYAQLRANFLKARDAFRLADKNDARARDLYAHHAIAEADLLQADSTREQAQADLDAAEQALRVLGISRPDSLVGAPASSDVPVLAPLAGEVVERLVAPGQVIQTGATQVFTISNLHTVWVLANVYEHDLGAVHLGDPVVIGTDAYPDSFHGRISYIAAALDPDTRTLQVRIVTQNPDERLKKDMYVTATVEAGVIRNALVVPDAAVLRNSENQPFVYVAASPAPSSGGPVQFAQRLVTIGGSEDGKTQILTGLKPGEQVAADGSLFLQFANSLQK